jgi:hypothetical protein
MNGKVTLTFGNAGSKTCNGFDDPYCFPKDEICRSGRKSTLINACCGTQPDPFRTISCRVLVGRSRSECFSHFDHLRMLRSSTVRSRRYASTIGPLWILYWQESPTKRTETHLTHFELPPYPRLLDVAERLPHNGSTPKDACIICI